MSQKPSQSREVLMFLTNNLRSDNISKNFDMFIMYKLLRTLGNSIRLDILSYLLSGEKCVCKIFDHLDLPQNLVSHHLGVLRKNGLIVARKDGKWVHYSLNRVKFVRLRDFVGSFSSAKNKKSKCC